MKIYFTLLFSFFAFFAFAQPVNDDCSGIIDLGEAPYCSDPAEYTNINATASDIDPVFNIPACFSSGGVQRDVWFQFTVPASGTLVDFTIVVNGNTGGNGTLKNPQIAVYRGDCAYGQLNELACASAANGVNSISLDVLGLTPGLPYFIRVNDYSATATPNSGTFQLCVNEFVPNYIIGETASTTSCSGTLLDSGGETGDYTSNENLSFSICPQDFHQCIVFNLVDYNTEENFDFIHFIQGADVTGIEVFQISGSGTDLEVQISGDCATVQFTSDISAVDAGFVLTWECSPSPCTVPPLVTCNDPVMIPDLPYSATNLSNCFSGNSILSDPCGSDFVSGNDYVFTYTSPGDECITVAANGASGNAGLGVYSACPNQPGASCISISDANGFSSPSINAAFLENAGTYYIVFGTDGTCSQFGIAVDTITCPVILPSASTCDAALDISGCSTNLPQIIALNPGQGDPNFIQAGVNDGCFVLPQQNYAFFYFTAQADGKFGFTVQAADPAEASDIDLSVWGPIANVEDICNFTSNNQPIRSTWAGGADPTGLEDIHPVLGTPVLDDFDCGNAPGAGGDDFVRRIDVLQGEIYVIMLDDYGQAIENGGISINFGNTTSGVFTPDDESVSITADTVICVGQSVQLEVTGGLVWSWQNAPGLSCSNCPNPVVTPEFTTTYQVQVATACANLSRAVKVGLFDLNLGPDITVCTGASFELNPNPYDDVTYAWIGQGLSCTDCPTPTVSGLAPGIYTYFAFLTSPLCQVMDTLKITVLPGVQPQYEIAPDMIVCAGSEVNLGGLQQAGITYSWTSNPPGFSSALSDPLVTPTATTQYFLSASSTGCAVPSLDSVLITINAVPILNPIADTIICQGQPVLLGNTIVENGVTYSWSPSQGVMMNPNAANPLETPQATTTYTLQATLGQCTVTRQVTVQVIPILLQINLSDTVRICQGTSLAIQASVSPASTPVNWSPGGSLQIGANNLSAVATPFETTLYTISAAVPGCTRTKTVYVRVDSLPADLSTLPSDTTICLGAQVLLTSPVYEPADYQYMDFAWTPATGQLTPDSLFNMVVQPEQTTIYRRVTQNGACRDTAFSVVKVIIPPTMQIVPADTSVCEGLPVQLQLIRPNTVTGIMWMPATGLTCSSCDNPVATVTSSTQFTAEGDFMGCPVKASANINIVAAPPIQFPTDKNLCSGESVVLNQLSDPAASYTWISTDPSFNQFDVAQPEVAPLQTSTYTVTATNGCTSSGMITITVASAELSVSSDTAVCRNEPVVVSASGSVPGEFLWSNGETDQAFTAIVSENTIYTVVFTYAGGCTQTAEVNTLVNGESAPLDLPQSPDICPGQSITLNNASVTAGAIYEWTSVPSDPTLAGTAGNPTVAPESSTIYKVVATLGNCTTTRTVTVTVAQNNWVVSPDITICEGDDITLTANPDYGEVIWLTGQETELITVSPAQTSTYGVTLQYGNGCILEDEVVVTVVPGFTLGIVTDPSGGELGLGAALELNAAVNPSQGVQNFEFEWLENGITNIGTQQLINTTITTEEDSVRYIVVATSPAGCVREASIGFRVLQPDIKIPNVFTPNNDNLNDVFGIVEIEGKVTIEEFEIYNRWGQNVFTGSATENTWDGNVGGKPAPPDVYIYRISWRKGNGALQEPVTGEVTLLR